MEFDGWGGGWGDDCEMLRHWGDVYFLTGDERTRNAAALLADGIVREIAPNGYLDEIGDVEHAAEPTSDTAFLAGLDYGWTSMHGRTPSSPRLAPAATASGSSTQSPKCSWIGWKSTEGDSSGAIEVWRIRQPPRDAAVHVRTECFQRIQKSNE